MTNNSSTVTSWATGPSDSWQTLQKGFKHLAVEYSGLSDKATKKAANEELRILEELEAFLALLQAYRVCVCPAGIMSDCFVRLVSLFLFQYGGSGGLSCECKLHNYTAVDRVRKLC